jgi:hypothetical protein
MPPHHAPEITPGAVLLGLCVGGLFLFFMLWCGVARNRMRQTAPQVFLDKSSGFRVYYERKARKQQRNRRDRQGI